MAGEVTLCGWVGWAAGGAAVRGRGLILAARRVGLGILGGTLRHDCVDWARSRWGCTSLAARVCLFGGSDEAGSTKSTGEVAEWLVMRCLEYAFRARGHRASRVAGHGPRGRSKQAFKTWLVERPQARRPAVYRVGPRPAADVRIHRLDR